MIESNRKQCWDITAIHSMNSEICVRHPSKAYIKYCEACQVPVCDLCPEHRSNKFVSFSFRQDKHKLIDIQEANKSKRQEYRNTFPIIKLETLLGSHALRQEIKDNMTNAGVIFFQPELLKRAQTLKNGIDKGLLHVDFKHISLKQKIDINKHIVSLQRYVHIYEESAISPVQFMSSIKTAYRSQKHIELYKSQLSMTESLNKEDVMKSLIGNDCLLKLRSGVESHKSFTIGFPPKKFTLIELQKVNFIMEVLSDLKTSETESPQVGMDDLLKQMSNPTLYRSISTAANSCCHISCMTPSLYLVSNRNHLFLEEIFDSFKNMKPLCIHHIDDLSSDLNICFGPHTIKSDMTLIYIDKNDNIIISNVKGKASKFIEKSDRKWRPRCVHWSQSTGDLLVGLYKKYKKNTRKGKVSRYNQAGQLTQTIKHKKYNYYKYPIYITENNNGDIIVSDFYGALVVTERGGKHRFFYTGHPSGSRLQPRGICSDVFSHILVCDLSTNSVHILDKNGQFLSHLLVGQSEEFIPLSLSYDANTHMVWVGSEGKNNVRVYNYIVPHIPRKASFVRNYSYQKDYPDTVRIST